MRTALFASLALTLAGCGDPLFFAEVEDRKVCLELPSEHVPAAPALPINIPEQTVKTDGQFDLGSQIPGLDQKGTTGSIKLLSLAVSSSKEALDHISSAEIDLSDASGQLQRFMHFSRAGGPTDGSVTCDTQGANCTLEMYLDESSDLFKSVFAGSGSLAYRVSLTGTPPTVDWTVKIDTCLSAKIMVDALQAMKN